MRQPDAEVVLKPEHLGAGGRGCLLAPSTSCLMPSSGAAPTG
jgi:hypothetical protein